MLLEVGLLLRTPKSVVKSLQAVGREEFCFGYIDVRVADQVVLYDFGDLLLLDTTRGMV